MEREREGEGEREREGERGREEEREGDTGARGRERGRKREEEREAETRGQRGKKGTWSWFSLLIFPALFSTRVRPSTPGALRSPPHLRNEFDPPRRASASPPPQKWQTR